MTLLDALDGQEYIIKQINTDDEELNAFLFSLGCYVGEPVTVVSHLKGGCVVSIKEGEIHTVFPPFYNFRMRQNLWPNALAKLCGAA